MEVAGQAVFGPVRVAERIPAIDVLRGFALLGILMMNIEAFVGPLNAAFSGLDPTLTGIDRVADALVYIFVQGKFYPLFSLLFGMGFALMMQRAGVEQSKYRFTLAIALVAMLYSTYAIYASGKDAVLGGTIVMALGFIIWGFLASRFAPREVAPAPAR